MEWPEQSLLYWGGLLPSGGLPSTFRQVLVMRAKAFGR
jgi:hypothetical protein